MHQLLFPLSSSPSLSICINFSSVLGTNIASSLFCSFVFVFVLSIYTLLLSLPAGVSASRAAESESLPENKLLVCLVQR